MQGDSIAARLQLPRFPELGPFGRLAEQRLPADAVASRETWVLRRTLTAREGRLVTRSLGPGRPPAPALVAVAPAPPERAPGVEPPLIQVGDYADLSLRLNSRLEAKGEGARVTPCLTVQISSVYDACRTALTPDFDFQFNVVSNGVVADRIHVDVDYDSEREFDASNNVSVYYQGKQNEILHRLEVGSVTFAPPPSRFITAGVPTGNYGFQAAGQLGPMRFRAIAAQQKGNIVRDASFTVGDRTERAVDRDIEDYQIEPRRFFFVVDPAKYLASAGDSIDILNRAQLASLAAQIPEEARPVRVAVYRYQIGSIPPNPNGPRFLVEGLPSGNRREAIYEVLRENVDYYIDPSLLWIALVRPPSIDRDRIVVAYSVRIGGRDTVISTIGGTPDVEYVAARDQRAQLLYDPSIRPEDPAFAREIRSVYRIGGEEVRRNTVTARIVAGAGGDQEKPAVGPEQTYLQMFGLSQSTNPAVFDAENRVWPRASDGNLSLAAGGGSTRTIQDYFLVFPSRRPFAQRPAGLMRAGNLPNAAIYTTPSEDLFSQRHPATVYRIRLRYQAEGSGDPGSLALGAVQLRRNSERLTVDGVQLQRGVDYNVDYELGRVTFTRPDTLFPRPRRVTVQYEENPLFLDAPTNVFGVAATFPSPQGELTFTAISQNRKTQYRRPMLGFEPASALVAGVNGSWSFNAPLLSDALGRLPFLSERPGASRIALRAELATSRPQPNPLGQAWLESFEGEGGAPVGLFEAAWFLSSIPRGTASTDTIAGVAQFDTARAGAVVWQNAVDAGNGDAVVYYTDQIDPRIRLSGRGAGDRRLQRPETLLWLTLQPEGIGFRRGSTTGETRWETGAPPTGSRRWRSLRTILSPTGIDLTRSEDLEFWALVDTRPGAARRNPTFVIDVGDVSENSLALAPTALTTTGGDSVYSGRRTVRLDTLDTERDSITRSFSAALNDRGIAPDRVAGLTVNGTPVQDTVTLCAADYGVARPLGDNRVNCTVRNNRLDEEDIDLDFELNYRLAERGNESFLRWVVDVGDSTRWVADGWCHRSLLDSSVDSTAAGPYCWKLIRVSLTAPDDSAGSPLRRRARALRLTMIAGSALPASEAAVTPVARLRLVGPPWLKRDERPLAGAGGDSTAALIGTVSASLIGTNDPGYQSPPGVTDEAERQLDEFNQGVQQINERSLRIRATRLPAFSRAEAFFRFPDGAKGFLGYRELRVWARGGNSTGWGTAGALNFFVRLGRDQDNFYLYRAPAYSGAGAAAWQDMRVRFGVLQDLRARIQNAYLTGGKRIDCTGIDSILVARSRRPATVTDSGVFAACRDGYIAYSASPGVTPPNLASVQEMSVGMLHVDSTVVFAPSDSLELWVDDMRLADVERTAGYAGQVAMDIAAGGIIDLRVVASRRDPYFRQIGEAPSFIGDDGLDILSTLRVDRLLPQALGLALPLTIAHSRSSAQPELLASSDLPGDAVRGLRRPKTSTTSYAFSARRIAPMSNPFLGLLLDNLALTGTLASSDARSEYQDGGAKNWNVSADYVVAAQPWTTGIPSWVSRAVGALPPWIADSDLGRAIRGASVRWNPAQIRFSSGIVRADDERRTFLKPAASADDAPRVVSAQSRLWRNVAGVELRPVGPLTLRWDATSIRDLRDYDDVFGDTSVAADAARRERQRLLNADIGLERERQMTAAASFAPPVASWLKPRLDMASTFSFVRDPNARQLSRADSLADVIPRRFGNTQTLTTSAQVDLQRALRNVSRTSRLLGIVGDALVPVDMSFTRSLTSAYDDETFTPGFGYQFALGGAGNFKRLRDRPATAAGLTNALAVSSGLDLPLGFALVPRWSLTTTRSWYRRTAGQQDQMDGVQRDFPDVVLRWSVVPDTIGLSGLFAGAVKSAGLNLGARHTRVASITPPVGGAPDERVSRIRSYPLTATISWGFGDLTTSAGWARTIRDDTLPGTAQHGLGNEKSLDVSRSWKLPSRFNARSPLRTRLAWQEARTRNALPRFNRYLADNGRRVFSLSADTDLNENMTFSLQGGRTATLDRNYNRRFTQTL
ncbi:MAG TPA: cell surface protein SprA, partial [Gemmatimonadaceae bacterium]|nr:cell surface protein SprA [Gemmatimonadaceae bacterium]